MALLRRLIQAVVVAVVSCSVLGAATITVDLNGGADYTEIQPAIDAAKDGDTVLVKPGEYVVAEPIKLKEKKIAVKSEAGPEKTTIRMSEAPSDPAMASVVIFEGAATAAAVGRRLQ